MTLYHYAITVLARMTNGRAITALIVFFTIFAAQQFYIAFKPDNQTEHIKWFKFWFKWLSILSAFQFLAEFIEAMV